jgi:hypothetical protein
MCDVAAKQVDVEEAYDPARAKQEQIAAYEEMRNGYEGDRSGQQERDVMQRRPDIRHKANYADGQQAQAQVEESVRMPSPKTAPPTCASCKGKSAKSWWQSKWLWVAIVLVLLLVALGLWFVF